MFTSYSLPASRLIHMSGAMTAALSVTCTQNHPCTEPSVFILFQAAFTRSVLTSTWWGVTLDVVPTGANVIWWHRSTSANLGDLTALDFPDPPRIPILPATSASLKFSFSNAQTGQWYCAYAFVTQAEYDLIITLPRLRGVL